MNLQANMVINIINANLAFLNYMLHLIVLSDPIGLKAIHSLFILVATRSLT